MHDKIKRLEKKLQNTAPKLVLTIWDTDICRVNGTPMKRADAEQYRRDIQAMFAEPVFIDVQADGFGAI